MLFGSFDYTIDAKGRLFLPSSIRSQVGKKLYIMKGYEGCLSVYMEADFLTKIEELRHLPYNQGDTRDVIRMELASVVELEVDEQGRLLLPKKTLAHYQIDKKVTIVGVIDHFEIWSDDAWSRYLEERESNYEEKSERLPNMPK